MTVSATVTVPKHFTECEVYEGFTIALYCERYVGFGPHDQETSSYNTRADCRKAITEGRFKNGGR